MFQRSENIQVTGYTIPNYPSPPPPPPPPLTVGLNNLPVRNYDKFVKWWSHIHVHLDSDCMNFKWFESWLVIDQFEHYTKETSKKEIIEPA